MTECTFKPRTNEGRNKKLINDLVQQIDAGHQPRQPSNDNKENRRHLYYNMPQQMTRY